MKKIITISLFSLVFSYTQETITFMSANPFSLKDIITDLENQKEQFFTCFNFITNCVSCHKCRP